MTQLIDFSWARPGATAIKNAGFSGVIRYLSSDTTGKTLSAIERDEYFTEGLSIRLVFEDGAQNALAGEAQGLIDGKIALDQAKALGYPQGYGIYFAVDFDANSAQLSGPIHDYGQGFAKALDGYYECAPYGGFNTVNGNGKSWQTCAWSDGKLASNANIYQNGASAFNGGADIDELIADDGWDWKSVSGESHANSPILPPNPIQSAGPGGTYSVVSGDTLSAIGAKLGVSWQAIASLNHIGSPYTIYPGERLVLPGGSENAAPVVSTGRYTVVSGDTLSAIGSKLGVQWQSIANANHINSPYVIYPGQVLVIPGHGEFTPAVKTYRVASGDTLSGIGSKLGISWESIAATNGIGSPYTIYPNEILRLP